MVGLTEPQERERAEIEGFEISVAKTSFKANTKALAENEGEGLAKHWVVQALNVDTGANHSAEGVKEQPAFDKKQFVAFVKKYIKPLSATSGGSVGLMVLISQAVYDGGRHVLGLLFCIHNRNQQWELLHTLLQKCYLGKNVMARISLT
ncbi:unnamed protein product [Camellia sinensis]